MKLIRKLTFLLVLFLITIVTVDHLSARYARILYSTGTVFIFKKGGTTWMKFNPTIQLAEGDQIKTSSRSSAEIRFDDGSRIKLYSNSLITLNNYSKNSNGRNTNIRLSKGTILANVKKLRRKSSFQVTTVTGTAGVRGTVFFVTLNKKKAMKVEVYDGKVNVKGRDKKVLVSSGKETIIGPEGDPIQPREITRKRRIQWKIPGK